MNLTAVREANEVMERHIEDSLAIIPPIKDSSRSHCSSPCQNLSLVDVGSGAGLPGLVLAVACPGKYLFCLKFISCIFGMVKLLVTVLLKFISWYILDG